MIEILLFGLLLSILTIASISYNFGKLQSCIAEKYECIERCKSIYSRVVISIIILLIIVAMNINSFFRIADIDDSPGFAMLGLVLSVIQIYIAYKYYKQAKKINI